MKDIEKNESTPIQMQKIANDIGTPDKAENMIEKFEFMMANRISGDNMDFTEAHIDKLIDVVQSNEDHAYEYHTKKSEREHELELKDKHTARLYYITLFVFLAGMTSAILFFKETYFDGWLKILLAVFGGYGLKAMTSKPPKSEEPK